MVMVPPPAHEPDRAVNGLVKACTDAGRATRPRRAPAAAMARADLALLLKDLLKLNTIALPLFLYS